MKIQFDKTNLLAAARTVGALLAANGMLHAAYTGADWITIALIAVGALVIVGTSINFKR